MGKILILIGLLILFTGLIIHFSDQKLNWFGNLYGDFKIVRSNYRVYFPFMSMLVFSAIISIALNFLYRFFK